MKIEINGIPLKDKAKDIPARIKALLECFDSYKYSYEEAKGK